MKSFKPIYLLVFLCFLGKSLLAEDSIPKRVYNTSLVNGDVPVIDGLIREQAWNDVEWSGDFTQRSPNDGDKPTKPTAFKILYDHNNLYVAIRAFDDEPEKIVKRMSRRDGFEGDWVEINIDSYHDQRTAFSFTASVSGVKGDEMVTNDGNNWDATWDPLWDLKTSIDDRGWVAEMRIPLTQLRFNKNRNQVWGIQFSRRFFRNEERSVWQYVPQEEAGWVHHFGELHGIHGIQPKKQVEVAPYVLSKAQRYEKVVGNPFADGSDLGYQFGLDGKLGITNDLTLGFTVNPDFGQVEADPSEVNLTAFETFFDEKRPFFIEGRNITSFQISEGGNPFAMDNLFYSRRIGRSPHHYPDVDSDLDEYSKVPSSTSILGAMKLTGKTRNGLSVGVIESLTAHEKAQIYKQGNEFSETAEPMTNYLVSRVQKDMNNTNTLIGGMFTSTNRFMNDPLSQDLNSDAYTGGFDFEQYWKDKKYCFKTNITLSHIRGTASAIRQQQESSRRYFQRPDNNYVNYDTTRTSLTGHGGTLQFGKQGNSKLRYVFWVTWRSPELELNDVGYLRQSDAIFQVFWAGYRITEPFSIFREMNINYNQWTGWDFGMNNNFKGTNVNLWTQFKNHWSFGGGINYNGGELSNSMLRGGPSLITPGNMNYWWNFGSDRRKKINIQGGHSLTKGFENAYKDQNFWMYFSYQPIDALRMTLNPSYSTNRSRLQYITSLNYNEEDRYIFGSLHRVTTSLTMRFDLTLSPELTLQYYGSPFISSVDYYNPKFITNPKADKFEDRFSTNVSFSDEDYEQDYDFNFRQFRSNMVLRWEYQPGSLLYLVWTQGRTGQEETGRHDFQNDLNGLFDVYPHNVFFLKLSYLLTY